jgi:NAD(P)-dependent dehydrogenase (short-subunit alcohol dehydrogenase family)
MPSILIAGGNSGIGLEAARSLVAQGHDVVLLGRDQVKGERAVESFAADADRVHFVRGDLSTHDGVRDAAVRLLDDREHFDALVHTTGVFIDKEERTTDGLHPFFAVNYLSRFHLTQLLIPALRGADKPRVIMMTAKVPPSTPIDFSTFPKYQPFKLFKMRLPIQVANHHYAAHLARTEPTILAGVVNAGSAKTDIMRQMPRYMRAGAAVLAPVMFNSVEESAHNVVEAAKRTDWSPATYWDKPGMFHSRTPIEVDPAVTAEVIRISTELTQS